LTAKIALSTSMVLPPGKFYMVFNAPIKTALKHHVFLPGFARHASGSILTLEHQVSCILYTLPNV